MSALHAFVPAGLKRILRAAVVSPFRVVGWGSTARKWDRRGAGQPCPVCGGTAPVFLHDAPISRFFMFYDQRRTVRRVVGRLHISGLIDQAMAGRHFVRYVCCRHCDTGYQDFPHTEQTLAEYYRFQYRSGVFRDRGPHNRLAKERIARCFIARAGLPAGSKVLDVGCAEGITCLALQQAGYEAHGVEPFGPMVDYACQELGLTQVKSAVYTEDLYAEGQFDGVILYHVLEHVFDIKAVLAAISRHLRPGGVLMLQVPSREIPLNAYSNDHFTVWSERALILVLGDHGFTVFDNRLGAANLLPLHKRVRLEGSGGDDALKPGARCLFARRI